MQRVVLLLIVCAPAMAHAQTCEDAACPCAEEPRMDPQTRDDLATGLALFGAAYTVGMFAQIAVPATPAGRLFGFTPVFGAIAGAANADTPWDARLTLIFSAGTQVAGILFAITAVTLKHPDWVDGKKVGFNANGAVVHF